MNNIYFFQPNNLNLLKPEPVFWLPHSVACLWSYVRQFTDITDNFQCQDLAFKKERVENVVERMKSNPPDVVALSFYVWNTNYNKKLAEHVHENFPNCKIIVGGPQVNTEYLNYDWCGHVIDGEGEENFLQFLRDILSGSTKSNYEQKRIHNLDIPSPYPVLDEWCINRFPDYGWYSTFETNRGCPYACTFCNWGSVTASNVIKYDIERLKSEIEWFSNRPILAIFGADANWGILKRDVEIARMLRKAADKNPYLQGIALQYAKNSNRTVFEVAKELGNYTSVTCSLQSTNEHTLEIIKRKNMKADNVAEMMKLSVEYKVPTYTELILGLPEETLDTFKDGLCEILESGQHYQTNIYLLILLENSELAGWDSRLEYGYKTYHNLEDAHDWASGLSITKQIKNEFNIDSEITESLEIVQSTNTMSNLDICEAFVYYFMIYNFHSLGFTRYLSKYARASGISYRKFYDRLWNNLNQEESFDTIKNYLIRNLRKYTGTLPNKRPINVVRLRDKMTKFLCNNFDVTWRVAEKTTKDLDAWHQSVWDFQRAILGFSDKLNHELPYDAKDPLPTTIDNKNYIFEIDTNDFQSKGAGMDHKENIPKILYFNQVIND